MRYIILESSRSPAVRVRAGAYSLQGVISGLILLTITCWSVQCPAEEQQSRAGHGHISVSYQYISVDSIKVSTGTIPIGPVDTHTLNFELDYNLTDKITLVAGIPFVRKRYQGPLPHDPLLLVPPRPEIENVDLGDWNTSFQDFHLGVRYLWKESPLIIEPFVFLGVPSHDYPFFGNAAVGQNLLKLDVGASFAYVPPISDAYYQLEIARVFVEETLGVSIDHWRVHAEAGYFFGPRITGRLFVLIKEGKGLDFPDDFPLRPTDERWYQHDRLIKHNYINVGAGLEWSMNDRYRLSTSVMTMTHAEMVHVMDYALNVGLSWSF